MPFKSKEAAAEWNRNYQRNRARSAVSSTNETPIDLPTVTIEELPDVLAHALSLALARCENAKIDEGTLGRTVAALVQAGCQLLKEYKNTELAERIQSIESILQEATPTAKRVSLEDEPF
jgi:hypothetical protein